MKRSWLLPLLALSMLLSSCVGAPPLVAPPPAAPTAVAPAATNTPAAAAAPAGGTATTQPATRAPAATSSTAAAGTPAAAAQSAATPSADASVTNTQASASGHLWQANEALPLDPSIRTGKLDNGLTYFLHQNSEPKNRAELRLVVNAGSALEDPDQLGLAHFIEHMLFRGTKRFPKQDLINFMEGVGMRFGPDVNAYTSFDETVYELRIPLDDPKVLDKALDVLVDWAGSATIAPEDVNAERGVIVEEHRLRELNASGRLRDQLMPILLNDSRYAQRLPIGDMNIVQNAPAETLRRFYNTWYRPDLMAVTAVGDFDAAKLETQIREKFAALSARTDPTPRPVYNVPDFSGTRYLVATDPENPNTTLQLYIKQPVHESQTAGEYRADLTRMLFFHMLNQRYLEISRQSNAPFIAAQAGPGSLVRTANANVISAQAQEQNILPALEAMLTEVERVRQYGFTQPELERAQADLLNAYRSAYDQRNSTDSAALTDEYIRHFLQGESVPGIAVEYDLARQFLPAITLDEVNHQIGGLIGQDNRVLVAVAPEKAGFTPPTTDDLAGAVKAVAATKIEPYTEQAQVKQLFPNPPAPAKIISETTISELGVTNLRLANGVRVLLKPTNFNQDEVLFTGSGPGGASLYDDKDYVAARLIGSIVGESGVGDLNRTELDRLLTGKNVQVGSGIQELRQSISGSASPRDLETAFQLINLYATQPRVDQNAVDTLKASARAALSNRELDPNSAMQDALAQISYGDSIRRKPALPLDQIENLDVQRALEIYKDRFANMGQFTFVFTGNFDVEQAKQLSQQYLGTLPSTGKTDTWQNRLPDYTDGVHTQDVYKGKDERSTTQIIYNGDFEVTPENEIKLSVLGDILDMMLVEQLREGMGGTYSPSAGARVQPWPQPQYSMRLNFTSDPARAKELADAAFKQVDTLRKQGPSETNLAKAKEQEKRSHEEELRQNGYWLSVLNDYAFDPKTSDPGVALRTDAIIDNLTVKDIQAAAQEFLRDDRYVKVVLYPASMQQSGATVLNWPQRVAALSLP
jgi:zinc protease